MQRKWLCVTLETLLCDYKVIIYSSNELKKRKKIYECRENGCIYSRDFIM